MTGLPKLSQDIPVPGTDINKIAEFALFHAKLKLGDLLFACSNDHLNFDAVAIPELDYEIVKKEYLPFAIALCEKLLRDNNYTLRDKPLPPSQSLASVFGPRQAIDRIFSHYQERYKAVADRDILTALKTTYRDSPIASMKDVATFFDKYIVEVILEQYPQLDNGRGHGK